MFKKLVSIFLILLIVINSQYLVALAEEVKPTYDQVLQNEKDLILKEKYLKNNGKHLVTLEEGKCIESINDYLLKNPEKNNNSLVNRFYDRILSMNRVEQETPWYCGVAATKMILDHKGYVFSQDFLAGKLGTTENGTSSFSIKEVLSYYTDYYYVVSSPTTYPGDNTIVRPLANIKNTIDDNFGVTYSVKYNVLSSEVSSTSGHFVTGVGYRLESIPDVLEKDSDKILNNTQLTDRVSILFFFDPYYSAPNKGLCARTLQQMYDAIVANEGYVVW